MVMITMGVGVYLRRRALLVMVMRVMTGVRRGADDRRKHQGQRQGGGNEPRNHMLSYDLEHSYPSGLAYVPISRAMWKHQGGSPSRTRCMRTNPMRTCSPESTAVAAH